MFLIQGVLHTAERFLRFRGIATPRLDAQVLLAQALGRSRSWLMGHDDMRVSLGQLGRFSRWVLRRGAGWSVVHASGQVHWAGLDLRVTRHVLAPRDETEQLVTHAAQLLKNMPPKTVLDIGTGSGAIACWAAMQWPQAAVTGIDISRKALRCARHNNAKRTLGVQLHYSDLLLNVDTNTHWDCIFANLPYVPTTVEVARAVQSEPALAVFSGTDGMDAYRRLAVQLADISFSHAFLEFLPSQWNAVQHVFSVFSPRPLTDVGGDIFFCHLTRDLK